MEKTLDYVSPSVEVILFDSKDVIATSGGGITNEYTGSKVGSVVTFTYTPAEK